MCPLLSGNKFIACLLNSFNLGHDANPCAISNLHQQNQRDHKLTFKNSMLPTGPWCTVGIMSRHLLISGTGRGWSKADQEKINHRGNTWREPWELCKSVNDIHWKIIHNLWQSVEFPFRPLSSKRYGAGNMSFFIDSPGEDDSPRRTSFGIFPSHGFNNLQYWFETKSRAVKSPDVVHCFHLMVYWSAALALCTTAEDTYESIHRQLPEGGVGGGGRQHDINPHEM